MSIIKTALIGYGKAGQWMHAPFIHALDDFELTYVLERTQNKSQLQYPQTTVVRSLEPILEDPTIELVVIATPNHTHFEMVEACLKAGKHVVVDKPFVVKLDEAVKLQKYAKSNQLNIFVFQNRRWDGDFITVRNILEQNVLGKVSHIESHFDRYRPEVQSTYWKEMNSPGSGLWYDLGAHLLDQALVLKGVPLRMEVDLQIQRKNATVVDYFDVLMVYNDLTYRIHADMMQSQATPRWSIQGAEGTYTKYGTDIQEALLQQGAIPQEEEWAREQTQHWGKLNKGGTDTLFPTRVGNYSDFYKAVYNTLRNNESFPISMLESLKLIELLERIAVYVNKGKTTIKL
jgi:scyllo-inositol 2-dehydrogenase (NADP+)